jgi:hypothetical protein
MERLTTAEAVKRTGASRFVIHRAKNKGELNPVRGNDGRFMFDPEELDAWAELRARTVAQPLRGDDVPEAAQPAAHSEIEALRAALVETEKRATDAEKRAAVAEALADERAARIEDLRAMLPAARSARWWPWGRT